MKISTDIKLGIASLVLFCAGFKCEQSIRENEIEYVQNKSHLLDKVREHAVFQSTALEDSDGKFLVANDTIRMLIDLRDFTPWEKRHVFPMSNAP
jgi:hypothetical protein